MCSTSHIPTFFSMNAFDSTYLLTKYGENSSVYHKIQKRRPSMVHDTSKINTESVKLSNHNFVKDTTSPCVSRKRFYHRLCGTSLYEVSKYSYDDENNS